MSLSVSVTGLLTGLSLIVAIGAQNAFVLRQGLMGAHVFAVALACSLSDAALIALGVTSFRQIAVVAPWFLPAMRYGGAAFLIWYGARNLYSALRSSEALTAGDARASSLAQTLAMCLALTWLNPHVYLDTLMLLGAISTRFPGRGGVVRRWSDDRLVPLFLLAWLWREMVAADFHEPVVLAGAGGAHRRHDVGDRLQTHSGS